MAHNAAILGNFVQVTTASQLKDGTLVHAALVLSVNEDASLNLRVFANAGLVDYTYAGVKHQEDAGDSPVAYWTWPA